MLVFPALYLPHNFTSFTLLTGLWVDAALPWVRLIFLGFAGAFIFKCAFVFEPSTIITPFFSAWREHFLHPISHIRNGNRIYKQSRLLMQVFVTTLASHFALLIVALVL